AGLSRVRAARVARDEDEGALELLQLLDRPVERAIADVGPGREELEREDRTPRGVELRNPHPSHSRRCAIDPAKRRGLDCCVRSGGGCAWRCCARDRWRWITSWSTAGASVT